MTDGDMILPSDSDNRPDVLHMLTKSWEDAEHEKVAME